MKNLFEETRELYEKSQKKQDEDEMRKTHFEYAVAQIQQAAKGGRSFCAIVFTGKKWCDLLKEDLIKEGFSQIIIRPEGVFETSHKIIIQWDN